MNIRHKMILCTYFTLLPVLIIASLMLCYINYNATIRDNEQQYKSITSAVDKSIAYLEGDVRDMSRYFSVNEQVRELLSRPAQAAAGSALFWMEETPLSVIKDMMAIKSHLRTLILYPENGLPPFYVSNDATVHAATLADVRQLPCYERAVAALGDIVTGYVAAGERGLFDTNRAGKVVFCRELFDLSKKRRLGFLAISVDGGQFDSILDTALIHENESMVVLDRAGQPIARRGAVDDAALSFLMGGGFERERRPGQSFVRAGDYYIFGLDARESGNGVYYLSPKANWDAWIMNSMVMPIVIALALLLCVWPLSYFGTRMITRPINALCGSMQKFQAGDFTQELLVSGKDEIAQLSRTFNGMVRDIRELVDRNYVMALREKQSELDALQAQINPHFLYNALDTLYWQAETAGDDDLAENILTLSSLFRLLLNSGSGEIPVEREFAIVENYLRIQKVRFASRLAYEIDLDEEIARQLIPKLILQPFVENAVVHGLAHKQSQGMVKVSGRRQSGYLVFTVEDNGVGMTRQKLDELRLSSDDGDYASQRIGHYAIHNVRERMALRYGENCRFEVHSQLGEGSLVRITLPALQEEGGAPHGTGGPVADR